MDRSLFAEVELASADEMLDALLPHKGRHLWPFHGEEKAWLFRGQADAAWGLTPSAMRPGALFQYALAQVEAPARSDLDVDDRLDRETYMVMVFAALADRAGFPLPGDTPELRSEPGGHHDPIDFPPVRHRGLFALAQHYGVPTRFLDWTPRPLVAAYFACVDAAEANRPYKMRRKLPERRSERCALWALSQQCLRRLPNDWDPTVSIVTAPAAMVPNLAAQAGRFTLVHYRSSERAHEEDPPDLDNLFRGKELPRGQARRWAPVLYKFTFPASEAGRLLHLLSLLDVTAATVFPGLAGVERSMFEMTLATLPAFRGRPDDQ